MPEQPTGQSFGSAGRALQLRNQRRPLAREEQPSADGGEAIGYLTSQVTRGEPPDI